MGRPLTLDKIHISDQGIMGRIISHIFSKNYIKVQNKPLLIKKKPTTQDCTNFLVKIF